MPINSQWIKFNFKQMTWIENYPAVYVIYLDGKLSYVGSTLHLVQRMRMHFQKIKGSIYIQTQWGKFKQIIIKASYYRKWGDWAMRELRLIHRLHPPRNVAGNRSSRANSQGYSRR